MRTPTGVFITIGIMLLLDTYIFQAVKAVSHSVSPRARAVSYTHLRAHETVLDLVCRLLLEKKKHKHYNVH